MNENFISLTTPPDSPVTKTYGFLFQKHRLLVIENDAGTAVPALDQAGLPRTHQQYLGYLNSPEPVHCYVAEVAETGAAPEDMAFRGLRGLSGRLTDELLWLAGRAYQILEWDRTSQYCGRCGTPTSHMTHERAKQCQHCGHVKYPRISPAVIVRVERHDRATPQILLANGRRFRTNQIYSVLAGFVEPGETLETCVAREIQEEVGITVKNIRYFGSQPWPFPDSLMIAFVAEYAGGELVLEEAEIAAADWFEPNNLPLIPPKMSIARRLIDDFVAQHTLPSE